MSNDRTLMEFPCDFQIKIIGKNSALFTAEILLIARHHFPDLKDTAVSSRPSKHGQFLAISLNVYAHDQVTLDALYQALQQDREARSLVLRGPVAENRMTAVQLVSTVH